jgi:hypothetical protein
MFIGGDDYKAGDFVQIRLADVDTTKVDSNFITAVVIDVSEHNSYRVACKQGAMKSVNAYHRLIVCLESQMIGEYMDKRKKESWRVTTALSEREAARLD